MRRVLTEKCLPGVKLARSINSSTGRILLGAGVELKPSYIQRLINYGISEIYIDDEISQGIEVVDVIDDRTRMETKVLVKNVMDEFKTQKTLRDIDSVKLMVDKILDELLSKREIVVNLSDIKSIDDYTYSHSVNVCILSVITGIKLGLNQLKIRNLGIGALLHDIGKVTVPDEILKKPSSLNDEEYEIVKKHTTFGHEILRRNKDINATSSLIALAHHERIDGSGYPLGTKGKDIHVFARITAITDVFDALTSDRVYRKKMKTHEALEYLYSFSNNYFDKEIVDSFARNIAFYSKGTSVMIDTGQKGIVIGVNKNLPMRPIIKLIYNKDGTKCPDNHIIDLTKKLNVVIIDTCDI